LDSRPGLKGDEGQDDGDSDFDAGASSKKSKKDKRGKKRKAKDSKKSSKKKKKRKANSDLSDNEGGEPVEEEEEEHDYTPKAKSKKGAKKSADSSPAPTPQATNDETPSVEEVCENFGLNDVDLDYSDADYQNLTTYKMFQQAYRSRIQSANPKVRYFCLLYPCLCFDSIIIWPMLLQKLQKFVNKKIINWNSFQIIT
jgi:chromodomain-helicase-DNA-binding protein 4